MSEQKLAEYEVVIGIECHVQLATKSKLFCSCDNDSKEAEPNTNICGICIGLPGTLPLLNARAVELAIRLGLGLNAEIAEYIKFDRKNYFYPDLPKGYQITQFDHPIVGKGEIEFPVDGVMTKIGITRAHLEGDAGKLTHPDDEAYSLVDFNRAETPLVEIVSEPDMRTAREAKAYAQELYNIVRYTNVGEANLYYGNMRFDVNVSVRKFGAKEFGTRTETKNLNSFRAIEQVVEYESKRQMEVIEDGGKIRQETRGWNDVKNETYPMRSKEDADEYRYFPEPDIPPLDITKDQIDQQAAEINLLPNKLRDILSKARIPAKEIEVIISEPQLADFWYRTYLLNSDAAKFSLNWLVGDQIRLSGEGNVLEGSFITPETLVQVAELVSDNSLSSTNAKLLLENLWTQDTNPKVLAQDLGLMQQSDEGELGRIVDQVIGDNQKAAQDLAAGNQRALGALVGAAMKATKGQGNPQLISKLINERLNR